MAAASKRTFFNINLEATTDETPFKTAIERTLAEQVRHKKDPHFCRDQAQFTLGRTSLAHTL